MKKLVILLSLLACLCARADSIITATITITNTAGTVNGETITVNGVLRTWTNSVTVTANQILTNSTISGAASNLFLAYTTARAPSADIFKLSTNAITLKSYVGSPMAVTISAGWGTVSLATNSTTGWTDVRVPISVAGPTEKTNVESGLVDYLNDNSGTNAVSASSNPFTNFVNRTTTQTITGAKNFTGANIYSNSAQQFIGGTNANMVLTNVTGNITNMTNLGVTTLYNTNPVTPQLIWGSGTNHSYLYTDGSIYLGDDLHIGIHPDGSGYVANGLVQWYIDGKFAFGDGTSWINPDGSVSFANGLAETSLNGDMALAGGLKVLGSITNAHFLGTNIINGDLAFLRKNVTSLANGNNSAVPVSTNLYCKLSGPSAAFTINGILADGGNHDGLVRILQNSTTFIMTVANDSGTDPTASNRIFTGTAGDITVTNCPGFVELIYDSATTHWCVKSKSN